MTGQHNPPTPLRESAVKGYRERCMARERAFPIGLRTGKARGKATESGAWPDSALCLPDCVQGKRGEGHLRAVHGQAARFAYRIECRESAVKGYREQCKAGQRALPIGLRVGKARGRATESGAWPGSALCLMERDFGYLSPRGCSCGQLRDKPTMRSQLVGDGHFD